MQGVGAQAIGLWEEPIRGPPAQGPALDRDAVAQALAECELTFIQMAS